MLSPSVLYLVVLEVQVEVLRVDPALVLLASVRWVVRAPLPRESDQI